MILGFGLTAFVTIYLFGCSILSYNQKNDKRLSENNYWMYFNLKMRYNEQQ